MNVTILAIESSCDDTSAAVLRNEILLSNVVSTQLVHEEYGGVVPELASRAHQKSIVPVIDKALKDAKTILSDIDAIAFTRGPGLLGSLLVGVSFAKGLALANNLPLIEVDHLEAHILAHFIKEKPDDNNQPNFPFLCLLVSGGNSQIIKVNNHLSMEIIGQTIDDAAGEAFDKCAKIMGLPYPGGPHIDKFAKLGDANAFQFAKPKINGYNYSFSGLKTSFLYFLRDRQKENPEFVEENKNDLCASLQKAIVDTLMQKLILASKELSIKSIALAGGVSANSGLREALVSKGSQLGWKTYIPDISLSTDNAAMVAISGYYKYLNNQFTNQSITPYSRNKI